MCFQTKNRITGLCLCIGSFRPFFSKRVAKCEEGVPALIKERVRPLSGLYSASA